MTARQAQACLLRRHLWGGWSRQRRTCECCGEEQTPDPQGVFRTFIAGHVPYRLLETRVS